MRLWHYELLPYLPDAQFKGQLRELVLILHDWRDKGTTNHLLINRVMDYPKSDLFTYWSCYHSEYINRYHKTLPIYHQEFLNFSDTFNYSHTVFSGWHNTEYLRVCMANLYEKWKFGKGKSRITDEEWQKLYDGYNKITGERYKI